MLVHFYFLMDCWWFGSRLKGFRKSVIGKDAGSTRQGKAERVRPRRQE